MTQFNTKIVDDILYQDVLFMETNDRLSYIGDELMYAVVKSVSSKYVICVLIDSQPYTFDFDTAQDVVDLFTTYKKLKNAIYTH